jgi:uncharacterized membrane protein YoaK (UPF0700 family)
VYFITAVCGMLDTASFLGLGLIFVETMTGNLLLLAFSLGVRGTHGRFASAFPGGTIVPDVTALGAFAVGAVFGGRLVRAGERGRRTNLYTLTYTGLFADSTLGGGDNPRALRRSVSIAIFFASAIAAAFMSRYGILWPVLTAFILFALALPILLQPRSESNSPE